VILPQTFHRRAFPVADRTRDGVLYETENPRLTALRLCREKISENRAGLDPYDSTIFILVARPHEVVFVERMLGLLGEIRNTSDEQGGGKRFRVIVALDVRAELHLDSVHAPIKDDEPLASRGVTVLHHSRADDHEAILRVVHPLQLVVDNTDPEPIPIMRAAMDRAARLAALRVDCGCGAPAGLECRCTVGERLASAVQNRNEVH
jgi:hypothetical protein